MTGKQTWVLVADGAHAQFYTTEGRIADLQHAEEQDLDAPVPPGREIGSDRPGRSFESADDSRHGLAPHTDWRQYEKHLFAKQVAEILNTAALRDDYQHLVLVAPPKALGELRKALNEPAKKRLSAEIDKDLTQETAAELLERLARTVTI